MKFPSSLTDLFRTYVREGGIVFIGDVLAKSLTFLITIVLFRLVTVPEFGLYSTFITILALVNQFTDSGLHQSFIRFYAFYQIDDTARADAHFAFALRVKSILLLATSVVLLVGARFIADVLLHTPALEGPIRLLSIGVIGSGVFEFIQAAFQARQRFRELTILRVSEGAGKIGAIALVIALGVFSLDAVFLVYVLVPLVVATYGLFRARSFPRPHAYNWRDVGGEVFAFGKWMMLSSFATMFLMRLDVFMIMPLLSNDPNAIGLYNTAVRLSTPLIVLTGSVATVFFPKAMALRSSAEIGGYVRRTLRVTLPIIGLCLFYLLAVRFVLPLWSPKYADAFPMFAVLFVGYAWTIVGNPLTMLLLSINRAEIVTAIGFVQLVLTIASHYFFITHFGAIGAAISSVLMWFLAGIASMWFIYRKRGEIDALATART